MAWTQKYVQIIQSQKRKSIRYLQCAAWFRFILLFILLLFLIVCLLCFLIGHRIRGRLTKRNESKIFSDGYVLPNIMMETTLNSKFKDITGDDPKVRGESTFNFFTPEQAALIYSDNNLSRDYNEDGKELDAATDNIDDVDYTMSVSGVLHRFVANESGRLYIRFNVIRQVAGTDDVFGVTEAWKSIEKRYK
eukprot:268300_1